jgi:flagellar basal body-associated protein FliL
MGWWIALGILVGILILPLGVSVFYDAAGVRVKVIAGFLRFTVFPMKKKEKKPEKEKAPQQKKEEVKQEKPEKSAPKTEKTAPAKKQTQPQKEAPGGSLLDFLPLAKLALKMVGELFGKTLHIDVLYVKLTMAGGDPCDLAVNYGKAWAALGNLWPKIDDLLTIKKRDIQIQCDFEGEETVVNARVDLTITLARVLGLLIGYGARMAWGFLKILNKRKKAAEAEKKRREKIINTRYSTKAVQDNES